MPSFLERIKARKFASAASTAVDIGVNGDTQSRLAVDAGGKLTWGDGGTAGDTNLYRDAANVLKTDDTLKVPTLFVDGIEIDTTGAASQDVLIFNGTKFTAASASFGGGGASLTVSDTPPASPSEGDLWFESDTAKTYVYYDSTWVEVGASGGVATLNDIGDVTAPSPSSGDLIQWNGTAWVNVASTTVGATNLDGLSDVVITAPEEFQGLSYNGTSWVNSHIPLVSYVRNAETTTITTGTCVYLFGSTGDHATVKRADNSSDTTSSKTVGVAGANITASNNGPVVTRGYVDGIDLSVGYTAGDILWLGKNGAFTKTKPTSPDHLVFIGVVVRATNNGIIYVATQNGYELDELHDVSINGKTPGDVLKYNGTAWVNDQIDLGTDTVGNYVSSVSGGTGINVNFTPGEGVGASISLNATLDNLSDVTVPSPSSGDFLKWNGTAWVNDAIDLGTDTNGNYMSGISAGTGISVTHTPGEGSTATIAVDNTVVRTSDTGTVTSTMIADGTIVNADVSNSAAIALSKLASGTSGQVVIANSSGVPTYTTLSGDVTVSNTGVVTIAADSVALGTDTTGNYVASLVAGTGITLTNGTASEGGTPTISVTSNTYQPLDADLTAIAGLTGTSGVLKKTAADTWALDTSTFVTTSDTGTVTSAMIANGTIVDADINSAAAISLSKLSTTGATTNDVIRFNGSTWTAASVSTGASVTVSDTPPSSPSTGSVWFESDTGKTYIYYDSAWIEIGAGAAARLTISATPPTSPIQGALWFDSDDGATYAYYGNTWIEVGASAVDSLLNTIDAKGDLLVGTGDNSVDNLAVGTNGQILVANSATTTGLQWQTPTYASTGKAIAMSIVFGG